MKRVGIITIHNSPNYGACLQSFALYEYLRQSGQDVEIIDLHRPAHADYVDSRRFTPFIHRFETRTQWVKRMIRTSLKWITRRGNMNTQNRKIAPPSTLALFGSLNSKIRLTRPFNNIDELYANPPRFDTYITGSDQVWNPTQAYCIEPYFLTFVKSGRKISYASSIGIEKLTSKEQRKLKKWLSRYDKIAVREASAQKFLSNLTGQNVSCVADPTFLLDREYWKELVEEPDLNDYILVFTLAYERHIVEYAIRLATESGKKLVVLGIEQPDPDGYIAVTNATVQQWLGYIANADMVITDSFHCTVFSIILSARRFFTYISPWSERGSRIIDLLNRYGLEDNLLNVQLTQSYETLEKIAPDYDNIKTVFDSEQSRSREFLLENL